MSKDRGRWKPSTGGEKIRKRERVQLTGTKGTNEKGTTGRKKEREGSG